MIRVAVAFALVLAACGEREINGTACTSDTGCNLFNAQGTCEATGFCSYPDAACLSGQRYAPAAGDGLANACVGDSACGARDQACCQGTVCADHLVCAGADTTATCQCGGTGQPCCDGTTCGAGLRCDGSATCVNNEVAQVAVGAGHTCVLFSDDTVWCWGTDVRGLKQRSAVGTPTFAYDQPTQIPAMSNVAELRSGESVTCARKLDGTLWCWGHGEAGQLGNGAFASSETPVQVAGLSNVTMFSVGRASVCAVGTVAGATRLYCWGRGGVENRDNMAQVGGRLGNGGVADSNVPVPVDLTVAAAAGQTVRALSVGNYHTCIVMSDNTAWCWGRNDTGQLGTGTTTRTNVPTQVVMTGITIPVGVTIDEVACSDGRRKQASTCIRLSDGTLYCWGSNQNGDLGDNVVAPSDRSAPSLPVVTTDFAGAKPVALSAGQHVWCARMDTGDVFCWGQTVNGSIPTGGADKTNFLTPQKLPVAGISAIDVTHHTACAIDSAKQLYCWGANRSGNVKGYYPQTKEDDAVLTPFHVVF